MNRALIVLTLSLFIITPVVFHLIRRNSLLPITPISVLLPSPTPVSTVKIGLVGDLGLGRHITTTARTKNDYSWSFQNVSPWLQFNDFNLANLESPIINNCPEGITGTFTFCGDPKFLPYLQQNKFIFNLNNNHIFNYGADGLSQTKKFLSTDYFYDNFYIKKINNISFGFLGYDLITYPKTDPQIIIDQIKKYKPQVDWLVVSLHWGNEYLLNQESWRISLAHQFIDAGADIIHGHHPHVWQSPEIYHHRPIFYSFGNFIFDQSWSFETSHSQIVRLTLTKTEIKSIDFFPIAITPDSQPIIVTNTTK